MSAEISYAGDLNQGGLSQNFLHFSIQEVKLCIVGRAG